MFKTVPKKYGLVKIRTYLLVEHFPIYRFALFWVPVKREHYWIVFGQSQVFTLGWTQKIVYSFVGWNESLQWIGFRPGKFEIIPQNSNNIFCILKCDHKKFCLLWLKMVTLKFCNKSCRIVSLQIWCHELLQNISEDSGVLSHWFDSVFLQSELG